MKTALVFALPLLMAPAALAQTAPDAEPKAAAAGVRHHPDFATWHKEMCVDHFARESGHLAYLQAKLGLTEPQQGLFNKWKQAVLDQAGKTKAACVGATPKADGQRPTAVEREAHMEKMLGMQLQSLQATRPALEALYAGLTTEQKAIFDRAGLHHGPHGGPFGHGGPHHGGPMMGREGPHGADIDAPAPQEPQDKN